MMVPSTDAVSGRHEKAPPGGVGGLSSVSTLDENGAVPPSSQALFQGIPHWRATCSDCADVVGSARRQALAMTWQKP